MPKHWTLSKTKLTSSGKMKKFTVSKIFSSQKYFEICCTKKKDLSPKCLTKLYTKTPVMYQTEVIIKLAWKGLNLLMSIPTILWYSTVLFRKCIFHFYTSKNWYLYRGSYMSDHVLLNLLNEFGKRDKMRGLSSTLSLFRNEFYKFKNTRARMLDSYYHMTLRLLWNLISAVKRYNAVIMYATLLWTSYVSQISVNH